MTRALGAGIFIAGLAALLVWTLQRSGSGTYPLLYSQALLALLLILLTVVLAQEIRSARGPAPEGDDGAEGQEIFTGTAVAGILVTAAYVWGWLVVGHVVSTAGFLFAALLLSGERRPAVILSFVIGLPVFIQLFFVWFLRIPLPAADWNVLGL